MRSPATTSRTIAALVAIVTLATLTSCAATAAPLGPHTDRSGIPSASRPYPRPAAIQPAPAVPGPPSGTQAQAAALARLLLARLILPSGADRLPQTPLPPSLSGSWYAGAVVTPSLDQYRVYELTQPMAAAAAFLAVRVPAGLAQVATGQYGNSGDVVEMDVTDLDQHVPAGIASAQVVLSVVPARSGGSYLRADAQIIWYPPRTAAEYIDPARYHALTITVSISGGRPDTVHKVVTSQAFIARLAEALDRMQAEPLGTVSCPAIFAEYQLAFSVSRHSRPVVVVSANNAGCPGAGITVNGQQQPLLTDDGAEVAALADQQVTVTSPP
jgi:hypothetical protein